MHLRVTIAGWRQGLAGLALALGLWAGAFAPVPAAWAEDAVTLLADEVGYDEEIGLYVARGHVEAKRDGKVLMADILTYNERTGRVTASGNVSLLTPKGDTIFGSYLDVSDDFDNGVVEGFKALLRDKSRLAAQSAKREGGTRTILADAVYTPCEPCKEHPERAPLWQVKAREVVRDEEAETITYHNAWLEMFDVPVLWTPYFRHPDVGVERQSGLLAPQINVSSGRAGVQYRQPYFLTLGTDKDLTITPVLRVAGNPDPAAGLLDLEYRQRLEDGVFRVEASGTAEDRVGDNNRKLTVDNSFRGHLEGDGLFALNDDWRWGFNLKTATDKTYLRQYHFGSSTWLDNQIFAEGFFGRSYFDARAFAFQTTDKDFRDDNAPFVLPALTYSYVGEPNDFGGYFGADFALRNIRRSDQRDALLISLRPSWTLPYTSNWGDIWQLDLSLTGDFYKVSDVDPLSDDVENGGFSGSVGRLLPQASLTWRYPFVNEGSAITHVVQPISQIVLAPDCCKTGKAPNDDSRSFEWDDIKVFDRDRFAGFDRLDTGSRFNYGVEWQAYGRNGGSLDLFLGQSLRILDDDKTQRPGSGIDKDLSDLVGRLALIPGEWLDFTYRFRYDVADGDMQRHEAEMTAGPDWLRVSLGYAQLDKETTFGDAEQIDLGFKSHFAQYWQWGAGMTYDLDGDDLVAISSTLGYQDECFGFGLFASYVPNGEAADSTGDFTALLQLRFTNLGNIGSNF